MKTERWKRGMNEDREVKERGRKGQEKKKEEGTELRGERTKRG